MNEVLMTIFDELLNGLAGRMKDIQAVIEQRKARIQEAQQNIRAAENSLKCVSYDDDRAIERINVWGVLITRLGNESEVLMSTARNLGEVQNRTREARHVAEERLVTAKNDLQTKQTELAVVEREYADVKKKWSEVSTLASQERERGQIEVSY